MLESSEGICYIDPDNMEFKDTMKNARKTFELPMESAMSCKVQKTGHEQTRCENISNTRRSRYARILEANEQTRTRISKIEARGHADLIATEVVSIR